MINLGLLDLPQLNFTVLADRFIKEEVLCVIHALPPNKVLGPDGFTTHFLQVAWDTIKPEIMQAFDVFWHMDTQKFHTINEAIMVLLPKKSGVVAIKDYCLISLIHVVGKLFSEVLTNWLTPNLMNSSTSPRAHS
jgi:hypothetical protein